MYPGQNSSTQALINRNKKWTGKLQSKVDIALRNCSGLLEAAIRFDVSDVCDPLGCQQVAHHILRGDADAWALPEADGSDFRWRIGFFRPEPSRNAPQCGGGGRAGPS